MSLRLPGSPSTRLFLGATVGLALAATIAVTTPAAQGRGGAPGQQKKTAPVAAATGQGLTIGRNVNMVSGTKWPTGDPYLQRQNEPSIAASTRNPLHLLSGANDYRTVDVPFVDGADETGDAWLGLFKSFDGGQRWQSTLVPGGYPAGPDAALPDRDSRQAPRRPAGRAARPGRQRLRGLHADSA